MKIERLWSVLDEFGPGSLIVRTADGLSSRPLFPVVDHVHRHIMTVIEAAWLKPYASSSFDAQATFLNEFSGAYLSIKGTVHRCSEAEDIATGWSALASYWFPDGPSQPGLVALRLVPTSADLWEIAGNKSSACWTSDLRGPDRT